jgi:GNAT superfamily N-acetyltransferase
MTEINYVEFQNIAPEDFIPVLNKQTTREHLVDHALFDIALAKDWILDKVRVDQITGCKVRAIVIDTVFVGWCGIQYENDGYEIAIVIDDQYWGIGKRVFVDILSWAKDFGHKTVCIHLLHTRPEYKFLRKIANRVYESELLGSKFTTYELSVN